MVKYIDDFVVSFQQEKLITITPDTIIEKAVQLMHDHKIRCLPVLERDKLYGIFTETDALDHFVEIFGLRQKGTCLTIALEDKSGTLLDILEVIKNIMQTLSALSLLFLWWRGKGLLPFLSGTTKATGRR